MNTPKMPLRNAVILFLASLIWGTAFVAQANGMEYLGPFTFNGIRSLMGTAVLTPLILVRRHFRVKREALGDRSTGTYSLQNTVKAGVLCGIFLFAASNLQQYALQYAAVGKAGFMTAMYIVMVPVLHFIVTRKTSLQVLAGVGLALAGLYFLCITGSFRLELADILLLLCALFFSFQILCIDRFADETTDSIEVSAIEFLVTGAASLVIGLAAESVRAADILSALFPLVYAGVFSSGIAYTFQIVGQKGADPTIASLIMSLESVISLLAGMILLGQILSGREILGCALMFAAILIVQIPIGKHEKTKQNLPTE